MSDKSTGLKPLAASLLLGLFSCPAFSHSIFLNCTESNEQIECIGSFSDGSEANNLPIEVISYSDELLVQGKTGANASFSVDRPNQDYYILMDAGPGHVVEVDMLDVQH